MAKKKVVEQKIIHKPLSEKFEGRASQKQFDFELVKREDRIAIYKKKDRDSGMEYFEAINIRKHNGYTMGGIFIPPAERYPSDREFGTYAWCCMSLERAEVRFNEFLNK